MESGYNLHLTDDVYIQPIDRVYWVRIESEYTIHLYISAHTPLLMPSIDITRITLRNRYSRIDISTHGERLHIREVPSRKGHLQILKTDLPLILLA